MKEMEMTITTRTGKKAKKKKRQKKTNASKISLLKTCCIQISR